MDLQLTKYLCSICQSLPQPVIFSNIHDLEVHVANHFSYTPYECGVCINLNQPYKFSTENSLLQHYSQCHPETKRYYILKYHSAETREVGDEMLIRLHESLSMSTAWQSTNNVALFNEDFSNSEPKTYSETYDHSSNNNEETTVANTEINVNKLPNTKSVQDDSRVTLSDFKLLLKEEINERPYETSTLSIEIKTDQEMNIVNGISSQPQEDYDSNSFNPNADNEYQCAPSESAQNICDNHMANERCVSIVSEKFEMPSTMGGPNDQSPSTSRSISPRHEPQTNSHYRSTSQKECFRKLYVTNLGSLSCQEIENAFVKFRELTDIWVAYDSFYACVTFKSYKDAHKALKQMRLGNIQRQKIWTTVTNPRSKRSRSPPRTYCVTNSRTSRRQSHSIHKEISKQH